MKQFFKFTLASVLGFFLSSILITIVSFAFLFSAISSAEDMFNKKSDTKVKDNTVLHLTLSSPIIDKPSKNPFEEISFPSFETTKQYGLKEVVESIRNAKEDERIKGIFLDLSFIPTTMANMQEVYTELQAFKESGKFIYSYAETYDQRSYYFASLADSIFLNPKGDLNWMGLRTELAFFKNALQKAGVEAQIIRGSNNKFKSAVEPFMYEEMSDANEKQLSLLINGIWEQMTTEIANNRGLSIENLNRWADQLAINSPEAAEANGMVDGLLYRDEVRDVLRSALALEEDKEINTVSLKKYIGTKPKVSKEEGEEEEEEEIEKPWEKKERVAIIYASGEIRGGDSEPGVMGSETIAKAIKEAREDSTVKAIVFRVNSPGGSALASEVIWRETMLAKEQKPFVVSMGGVAASGGYYISCGADKIYADPGTVTGSIGVFGIIPNFKEMFNDKLGVTFDGVKTNENADMMSVTKSLSDFQYKKIQESVDRVYATFKQRVADGRGMTVEQVDSIGQGRVWIGTDALSIGLIDQLGSLDDALAYAIEQAGVEEDVKIRTYPEEKSPFEKIMSDLQTQARYAIVGEELKEELELFKQIERMKSRKGIQAVMPYRLEVY